LYGEHTYVLSVAVCVVWVVAVLQVVGNSEAVERLRVVAKDGNMPHLLLSGPPVGE
jgi:hypothetical protein